MLGVLGFLSGIVQLFIDTNALISVKWLLFCLLMTLSLIFILFKVIYDLLEKHIPVLSQEPPIKYIENSSIFIIKKNEAFINNILVGGYLLDEGVERLLFVGVVHHVQDKLIQIRVVKKICEDLCPSTIQLSSIVIRPVIPFGVFPELVC